MYDVYFAATPNAYKIAMMLEELRATYRRIPLSPLAGEQFSDSFRALNPNCKIPVLVDHEPDDGGEPFAVFESGAILIYLAEKAGRLLPTEGRARSRVLQWLMWQMAGFGPMPGQLHHFLHYAGSEQPYALARYAHETRRLYGVLDGELAQREYIAGEYSIADIAIWPWVYFHPLQGIDLTEYPNIHRYFRQIGARPSAIAAMEGLEVRAAKVPAEIRRVMFGVIPEDFE